MINIHIFLEQSCFDAIKILDPTMKQNLSIDSQEIRTNDSQKIKISSREVSQDTFQQRNQTSETKYLPLNNRMLQVLKSKNEPQHGKMSKTDSNDYAILDSEENEEKIQQPSQCQICLKAFKSPPNLFIVACQHRFSYCQQCLQTYSLCRVNQFQQILCPDSHCTKNVDQKQQFFDSLPAQIKQKYIKIDNFYKTLDDPNSKMCPKEDCEGIISKIPTEEYFMICDKCSIKYCSKCLMKAHIGHCDDFYATFLWNKLNYRRCKQCGIFIEKNQGCNHIICRCGHQFCYICGEPWSMIHFQPHDENGRVNGGQLLSQISESSLRWWTCVIHSIIFVPKVVLIILIGILLVLYTAMVAISWVSCILCMFVSRQFTKTFKRLFMISCHLVTVIQKVWNI